MLFWTRGNSVDAHNQLILTLYLQVCRITRAGSRSKPTQFMGLLILWIWSNELNLTNTKLARSAWIRVWIRRLIFGWLILSITLLSINLQSMFPFVLVVNVISLIDLTFCSDLIFKALGPLYRGALVRNNENSQFIISQITQRCLFVVPLYTHYLRHNFNPQATYRSGILEHRCQYINRSLFGIQPKTRFANNCWGDTFLWRRMLTCFQWACVAMRLLKFWQQPPAQK